VQGDTAAGAADVLEIKPGEDTTMRKHFLAAVALCGLFGSAAAAVERPVLTVDVPFSFQVGKDTMPAGTYKIRQNVQNGAVTVAEDAGSYTVMTLSNTIQTAQIPAKGKLVFRRYGSTYFLSQIWTGGYDLGRQLSASKAEREMARAPQPEHTQLALVTINAR
jgi:hypothetical protein